MKRRPRPDYLDDPDAASWRYLVLILVVLLVLMAWGWGR